MTRWIILGAGTIVLGAIAFLNSHTLRQPQLPQRAGMDQRSSIRQDPPQLSVVPHSQAELETADGGPIWRRNFESAVSEVDPMKESEALQRLADELPDNQIAAVLEQLGKDNRAGAGEFRSLLVRHWAKGAPAEAANWALQLPDNEEAHQMFTQIAVLWAQTNLSDALAWAQQLPEGGNKSAALLSVGYEMARSDVLTATAMAAGMPPSTSRDELLGFCVRQWAQGGSDQAAAWATTISDVALRDKLLADIFVTQAVQNPFAAASLAVDVPLNEKDRNDAVVGIVERWAVQTPDRAAAWVMEFPEGPLRNAATENLIALWRASDLPAAGEWLNQLPMTSSRDAGVASYALRLMTMNYPLAVQWARTIQDNSARTAVLDELTAAPVKPN